MHILIHALAVRQHGGTARHLFNFLPALGEYGADHQFTIYVDEQALLPTIPANVVVQPISVRSSLGRVLWDVRHLPKVIQKAKADAVWNLLGFGALDAGVPQIMFQRAPAYYCRYYLQSVQGRELWEARLRRWWQAVIMRRSAHIITPTAAMRDMIRHHHPDLPMAQFSVLPHAFNPLALVGEWTDDAQRHFARLPADAVKLLYIGHILPYKDLHFMLEVFAEACRQSAQPLYWFLTIAEEDWPAGYAAFQAKIEELQLTERVILLGKVSGTFVGTLYHACDIVLFTSLCESFGWPLLEATSQAKPLLAVDLPLNRELAGDGALYYEYGDHAGAVAQLLQLIHAPKLRQQIGRAGVTHFEQTHIDWATYVARALQITKEAIH